MPNMICCPVSGMTDPDLLSWLYSEAIERRFTIIQSPDWLTDRAFGVFLLVNSLGFANTVSQIVLKGRATRLFFFKLFHDFLHVS